MKPNSRTAIKGIPAATFSAIKTMLLIAFGIALLVYALIMGTFVIVWNLVS